MTENLRLSAIFDLTGSEFSQFLQPFGTHCAPVYQISMHSSSAWLLIDQFFLYGY